MTCCGLEFKEGWKYCPKCGKKKYVFDPYPFDDLDIDDLDLDWEDFDHWDEDEMYW